MSNEDRGQSTDPSIGVFGDISGDKLTIDEGGVYKGKVNMDVISSKNVYEGAFQFKKS